MKILYLITITLLSSFIINAQDIIVTNNGDTISGKITNIKDGYIFYSVEESQIIKKSVISISDIQYYTQKTKSDKQKKENSSVSFDNTRLKFGLNFGGSYNLKEVWKEVIPDSNNYHDKLKFGLYFDGDFTYYLNKNNGVGIKYSFIKSSKKFLKADFTNSLGETYAGLLSDNITITFIGAFYNARLENNRNSLYANIGGGKITYKNSFNAIFYSGYLSGSAFAFSLDLGYDLIITNNISAGTKLSYYIGKINNIKRSVSDPIYYSSDPPILKLQNLNLSLGIRFLLR